MKITIAIDSFKGSLTTFEAGEAVRTGIKRVYPDANVTVFPIADGGEGTVDAICFAAGGEKRTVTVSDPLGRKIPARYGYIKKNGTAVIEMSAAAGLPLLCENERNPMNTTTYGVGEMILDAVKNGCRSFIIGIGGSATNDAGAGMLSALGYNFYDCNGEKIPLGARGLEGLCGINDESVEKALSECHFMVACDVKNPLCGKDGCSAVYGPQKGAGNKDIVSMDMWLSNFARLTKNVIPEADADFPGVGAAGGMGFALKYYLGAELMSGIDLVLSAGGIEEEIKDSDLVITGEGRLDNQTASGKAPVGVARIAKKYGIPVIALSGCVGNGAFAVNDCGIDAFFPILKAPVSLSEAMDTENATKNLSDTAEQILRLYRVLRG